MMATATLPGPDAGLPRRFDTFDRIPHDVRMIPDVPVRELYITFLHRNRDPEAPIEVKNQDMADRMGWELGYFRRVLGRAKKTVVQGVRLIRVERVGSKRLIHLNVLPCKGRAPEAQSEAGKRSFVRAPTGRRKRRADKALPSVPAVRSFFEPIQERERIDDDGIASTKQAAEIHACTNSSSSSFDLFLPVQGPRPIRRVPLASAVPPTPALTPRVTRLDLATASEPAIDLALLAALAERAAALLNVSPEAARSKLEGWVGTIGPKARDRGLAFGLFWIERAIEVGEARKRKSTAPRVDDWTGLLSGMLRNWLNEGGPPPPRAAPPPPAQSYHRKQAPPPDDPLPKGFNWRDYVPAEPAESASDSTAMSGRKPAGRRVLSWRIAPTAGHTEAPKSQTESTGVTP